MQLQEIIGNIPPLDESAMQAARLRQDTLTKPRGSLGRLEELSIQLAGIKANSFPSVERKAVIVMAADHGVALEGVSAYPSEVTAQMVLNFLRGGAAINVLARQSGARVTVVDIGVTTDFEPMSGLIRRKVMCGTRNQAHGPAMTRLEAEEALQVGVDVLNEEAERGLDLVATGDMGIGNTTPSSAIAAVLTGLPPKQVVGRGTGIDDQTLQRKIKVIEQSLAVNQPDPEDPTDVLHKVGGLEIAGLAGVMIAVALAPGVHEYLISAHQSVEIGHRAMLQHLDLTPLLDLNLRLGEGTGAALAFHLIEASTRILREMATFGEAGVSDKE